MQKKAVTAQLIHYQEFNVNDFTSSQNTIARIVRDQREQVIFRSDVIVTAFEEATFNVFT